MTFTHDDIRDRLVEFLYGGLDGDARVAFDAHVAGCERCRADVTEFQETRAVARAAVRAGLDQPVPAGVRARVLAAATAASAATNGHAAAVRAAAEAVKKPVKSEGPFAWLRARWAVPMFATVAVMGALLLTRETIFREAGKPMGELRGPPTADSPSAGAPAPAPREQAANAEAKVDEKTERRRAEPSEGSLRGSKLGGSSSDTVSKDGTGSLDQLRPAKAAKGGKAKAAASPLPPRRSSGSLDDLLEGGDFRAGKTVTGAPGGAAKPRAKADAPRDQLLDTADKAERRSFAQPPPPAAPAAGAAAPAPAPTVSARVGSATSAARDEAPRSEKKARGRPVMDLDEESASSLGAAAPASAVSGEMDGQQSPPPDPAAPLVARAEKLMASQKWAEAAAAYRQLISSFPKHEQVPNWKRRLSVVEAAAARAK